MHKRKGTLITYTVTRCLSGRWQDRTADFHDVKVRKRIYIQVYRLLSSSFIIRLYINRNFYRHLLISTNFYDFCLPNFLPISGVCQDYYLKNLSSLNSNLTVFLTLNMLIKSYFVGGNINGNHWIDNQHYSIFTDCSMCFKS